MSGLLRDFAANGGHTGRGPAATSTDVETRPTPPMPVENYLAHPHSALAAMLTSGADPDEVGRRADLYTETGAALAGFRDAVHAAIADSDADWQGAAGDAARRFLADTGDWAAGAGHGAQQAGARFAEHADALATARAAMPAERPFDYDAAMSDLRATTDPIAFATKAAGYAEEYRQSRAAHEEAARVLTEYDRRLATAADLPAFPPPPSAADDTPRLRTDQLPSPRAEGTPVRPTA
ncbi:hypothetical protein ACFPM7_01875 [Actinokineospora guangxiensis]|uniref:PPE family protein n=2 Tax=Actinokineospora guangxiensis TaxID=1490288 RepID=A0ABW0EFP7_9PSEU